MKQGGQVVYTLSHTTSFHGCPIQLHKNEHGWWWAVVPRQDGNPFATLSAFSRTPAEAKQALQKAIANCAVMGTAGGAIPYQCGDGFLDKPYGRLPWARLPAKRTKGRGA